MNTKPIARRLKRIVPFTVLAVAGLTISLTLPAQADTENGGFSQVTNQPTFDFGAPTGRQPISSQFGSLIIGSGGTLGTGMGVTNPNVTGWNATGYTFLYLPSPPPANSPSGTQADSIGGRSQFGSGGPNNPTFFTGLWGPGTPANFGGSSPNGLRPDPLPGGGGNFIALDGDPNLIMGLNSQGTISQTLNGLIPNAATTVRFDWATAQQSAHFGDTEEQLQVSLCASGQSPDTFLSFMPQGPGPSGSCSAYLPMVETPEKGFRPWQQAAITFIPTSTQETLSFVAFGAPGGGPPFVLLDNVSAEAPEPAAWSLLGIGLVVIAGGAYRRRKSVHVQYKAGDA